MTPDARPTREFFVGVDSDGCAFDTMEVKHKDCFIPNIVGHYRLAAVARHAREVAEFLNLYSRWRGTNRFPGLALTMDLLADHPAIVPRGFAVPAIAGLRAWLDRETRLGNPALAAEVARSNDPDLAQALDWSEAVNRSIEAIVRDVPPFPGVRDALRAITGRADAMVISATPAEALEREWREHDLRDLVGPIAGQEAGGKKQILARVVADGYDPGRVLMVGDAPGDLEAAIANGVLFFPIEPGFEEESWARLVDEGLPRFFEGTFAGEYMAGRVAHFLEILPETPPWRDRAVMDPTTP